jgi:hypothetical protein
VNFIGSRTSRYELQIADELSYADTLLLREQDAAECTSHTVPFRGESQVILILSKQNATELSRPIQEELIVFAICAIILTRKHIHTSPPQPCSDCNRNMYIHIESE